MRRALNGIGQYIGTLGNRPAGILRDRLESDPLDYR
jgi:hypothetical protein